MSGNPTNHNNIDNINKIFTEFSKNLLSLQQQQTKLNMSFPNLINNNSVNINDNNINNFNNDIMNGESNISKNNVDSQNLYNDGNEELEEVSNFNMNKNVIQAGINSNNLLNQKHKIQQKKGIKRSYNEMLENSMSIETDSLQNFTANKLCKKSNNEINLICPKNNDPIHYYYTDPLNFQLCFTEIRGSVKDYYYRC